MLALKHHTRRLLPVRRLDVGPQCEYIVRRLLTSNRFSTINVRRRFADGVVLHQLSWKGLLPVNKGVRRDVFCVG